MISSNNSDYSKTTRTREVERCTANNVIRTPEGLTASLRTKFEPSKSTSSLPKDFDALTHEIRVIGAEVALLKNELQALKLSSAALLCSNSTGCDVHSPPPQLLQGSLVTQIDHMLNGREHHDGKLY